MDVFAQLPRQILCRLEKSNLTKMIGKATMTAARKTPMITPEYADEAVEAKQEVRRETKGGGAARSAFRDILTRLGQCPTQILWPFHLNVLVCVYVFTTNAHQHQTHSVL